MLTDELREEMRPEIAKWIRRVLLVAESRERQNYFRTDDEKTEFIVKLATSQALMVASRFFGRNGNAASHAQID
jgi:hypothetical protein